MKKNYYKYIEALFFLISFILLLKYRMDESTGYLIKFSLGNFFYLSLIYLFLRIFIPFVSNKILKEIFRSRLNAFVLFCLLVQNLIVALNLKEHSYEEFFVTALEKFNTGGIFVSLFGKIYSLFSSKVYYSILGLVLFLNFIYTFGKIFGFVAREREKRKSGEYALNKQRKIEEKARLKRAKLEEKKIKRRGKDIEFVDKDNLMSETSEGDFLVDIKNEFHTILNSKEKDVDSERRRKIKEEIIKRHEENKGHREETGEEEKAEIIFVKEEKFEEQRLFREELKNETMKNYEQKNLFYTNEVHELSKALEVSIEKIQRAVELIHKEGIKGFGILEKELQVDSEQAERIYHRVKKLKEYR